MESGFDENPTKSEGVLSVVSSQVRKALWLFSAIFADQSPSFQNGLFFPNSDGLFILCQQFWSVWDFNTGNRSAGRVDLPGGDPQAQQRSLIRAKQILSSLPPDWRLIPGHRYDNFKGEVPDWISLEDALKHNYFLSNITMIE